MDLRRLEIFAKVAELGSFSRAAEALFLTQPTVSEHVRALEDELGVQLLDRLGRWRPSRLPAGRLLLDVRRTHAGPGTRGAPGDRPVPGARERRARRRRSTIPGE